MFKTYYETDQLQSHNETTHQVIILAHTILK